MVGSISFPVLLSRSVVSKFGPRNIIKLGFLIYFRAQNQVSLVAKPALWPIFMQHKDSYIQHEDSYNRVHLSHMASSYLLHEGEA